MGGIPLTNAQKARIGSDRTDHAHLWSSEARREGRLCEQKWSSSAQHCTAQHSTAQHNKGCRKLKLWTGFQSKRLRNCYARHDKPSRSAQLKNTNRSRIHFEFPILLIRFSNWTRHDSRCFGVMEVGYGPRSLLDSQIRSRETCILQSGKLVLAFLSTRMLRQLKGRRIASSRNNSAIPLPCSI